MAVQAVKCSQCHHEWQRVKDESANSLVDSCDWCGGDAFVLEEDTSWTQLMARIAQTYAKRRD